MAVRVPLVTPLIPLPIPSLGRRILSGQNPPHAPPRLQVWDVFDVSSKSFTNSLMRTSSYGIFAATTAISLGLATLSLPKPAQKE